MCQPSCSMICYSSASNYSEQHTALDWWIRGRSLHQEEFMVYEKREEAQFGEEQQEGEVCGKEGNQGKFAGAWGLLTPSYMVLLRGPEGGKGFS